MYKRQLIGTDEEERTGNSSFASCGSEAITFDMGESNKL
jgi:hypothetical protein